MASQADMVEMFVEMRLADKAMGRQQSNLAVLGLENRLIDRGVPVRHVILACDLAYDLVREIDSIQVGAE